MLAYVFWHWRRPAIAGGEYESRLERFQASLADNPPAGFFRSYCFAVPGAPWLHHSGDAYEDWYLVDGSSALDPLNDAAISASRQLPHDDAAAAAAGGTAGLYRLRLGASESTPRYAYWFAKPAGMTYGNLSAAFEGMVANEQAALWGRQMTLGPASEFCLHMSRRLSLPAGIAALEIPLRQIWPRPA